MPDLTTLASFKAFADVDTSTDDGVIGALITAYSAAARSYLGRDITTGDYSRTFDGRNQARQMLPQWPIVAVVSVTVDDRDIPARLSGCSGYRFDQDSVVLDGYRFDRGEANVQIAWRAGYDEVPADIEQAVNEWAGQRYALRDKQGWSSKSLAGETVSLMVRAMPDTVRVILDNWRAVV